MFSPEEISRVLFLDIETARSHYSLKDMGTGMQEMWRHKANNLKGEVGNSPEERYINRAAIYAEFGKVVCISFGLVYWQEGKAHLKVKSFYGEDESKILQDFKELLNDKLDGWKLCAHNGKEFDFPFLGRRYLINQLEPPRVLQVQGKKPWEVPYLDTMDLWRFGDYKNYTRLELLCHVFEVPSPKEEVDGSQVGELFWEQKEWEKIARYCERDVIATVQVFLRFCVLPLIEEEAIMLSS